MLFRDEVGDRPGRGRSVASPSQPSPRGISRSAQPATSPSHRPPGRSRPAICARRPSSASSSRAGDGRSPRLAPRDSELARSATTSPAHATPTCGSTTPTSAVSVASCPRIAEPGEETRRVPAVGGATSRRRDPTPIAATTMPGPRPGRSRLPRRREADAARDRTRRGPASTIAARSAPPMLGGDQAWQGRDGGCAARPESGTSSGFPPSHREERAAEDRMELRPDASATRPAAMSATCRGGTADPTSSRPRRPRGSGNERRAGSRPPDAVVARSRRTARGAVPPNEPRRANPNASSRRAETAGGAATWANSSSSSLPGFWRIEP